MSRVKVSVDRPMGSTEHENVSKIYTDNGSLWVHEVAFGKTTVYADRQWVRAVINEVADK